ncbi:hypothetical protein [Streptosporangium pseudovulgare]|uniref:hypothetical protein n=1 Tax=Streptosporangium pseudovulgare TaxID=35765 RepID=UPI0016700899|nr:hypothetical protein [Streptosporangium pseudovulgare]
MAEDVDHRGRRLVDPLVEGQALPADDVPQPAVGGERAVAGRDDADVDADVDDVAVGVAVLREVVVGERLLAGVMPYG